QAAGMLLQLRQKWHSLFLRRMRAPSKPWSQVDETTVRAITAVLSAEEQSAGLQQPSGIGQRPRPVTCEEFTLASSFLLSTNSRKSSTETELSDSSNAEKVSVKSASPALHQPKKNKEKDILLSKRSSDDRSAQSSVKPSDSSSYSSPCASPSSPVSGK
ncbi:YTDC2 helicase, partial [Molothrus ater]|nr:YTDC2 helicase [Molothrus ater]NXV64748.1 YTDC2 helicase [Molothrus ater]